MGSHILSELAQYPDKKLYKSAGLLAPQDRPNVPVRLTDNVVDTYGSFGIKRSNFNLPSAFVSPDKKTIFVNRKHEDYKDEKILASKIAHEAYHLRNDGDDRFSNERHAVQKEISVLNQYSRYAQYRQLIDHLKNAYGIK